MRPESCARQRIGEDLDEHARPIRGALVFEQEARVSSDRQAVLDTGLRYPQVLESAKTRI